MPQKCIISGGSFQDSQSNPLALGSVIVYLQQGILVGTVQVCAGIKGTLQLDSNGNVAGSPTLWGPVTYLMRPMTAAGLRATTQPLSIAVPDAPTFSLTPA